jgi:o-succinylbenzoate synthase
MQLTDLEVIARHQPFDFGYGVSNTTTYGETFLYIRLTASDGTTGIGEGAPSIPFSSEDHGTARHVILTYLRQAILGMDSLDIEAITARMDAILPGHPMAKAGIDIALHDLNGKLLNVPAYVLLGGAVRQRVPLAYAIGISDTDRMVREAAEAAARGFGTIKMKIGIDPRADLDRVRAVRAAIGDGVRLRVDANQGGTLADYLPIFRKMEAYDLEFIEQPLPTWDVEGLRALCAALDTPILLDESIYTPRDLIALIRRDAVDAVNIKVEKTGLSGGRRIAAIAEAAGLPCLVGSMIETGVGTAAGVHFAAATPAVTRACEVLSPAAFFPHDVIEGDPYSHVPPDCAWALPGGAGLGVRLRAEVAALFDAAKES